jgi:acetamidase/formamidase
MPPVPSIASARTVLQSGSGPLPGMHYLPSRPDEVHWGWLPNAATAPVMEVSSGDTITIDTVSHEGILEDQGSDPVRFLADFGVREDEVLDDMIAIAADGPDREIDDGPHVVTGPIAVSEARAGDVLRIDVMKLTQRAPYGFISMRHGFGALPDELPAEGMAFSHFCEVDPSGRRGRIAVAERFLQFPLAPFLGLMGVARNTGERVPSVPPGDHGGNMDVKHAVAGATVFLPVQVNGAMFYVGDPHFAQGNGEVALTALEAPLRATVRLSVLRADERTQAIGPLTSPMIETTSHWIPTGMDVDLDEAMRKAVRNAVAFLSQRFDIPEPVVLAYLSAAADFEVSQVVDAVKGVHCVIAKQDFAAWF